MDGLIESNRNKLCGQNSPLFRHELRLYMYLRTSRVVNKRGNLG